MLNRIFKVIFNYRIGQFVVTSELAKSHSKQSTTDKRKTAATRKFSLNHFTSVIALAILGGSAAIDSMNVWADEIKPDPDKVTTDSVVYNTKSTTDGGTQPEADNTPATSLVLLIDREWYSSEGANSYPSTSNYYGTSKPIYANGSTYKKVSELATSRKETQDHNSSVTGDHYERTRVYDKIRRFNADVTVGDDGSETVKYNSKGQSGEYSRTYTSTNDTSVDSVVLTSYEKKTFSGNNQYYNYTQSSLTSSALNIQKYKDEKTPYNASPTIESGINIAPTGITFSTLNNNTLATGLLSMDGTGTLSWTNGLRLGTSNFSYIGGSDDQFGATKGARSMQTIVNQSGLHLADSNGVEKATITLLNPGDTLPSNIADLLTQTGDNGAAGDLGTIKSGTITKSAFSDANNLGLLIGTMAKGSASGVKTSSGKAYMLSLGFDNYIVPSGTTQRTIFNTVLGNSADSAQGANVITMGYANSIMGNGGMAIGTLNRVYGNGGLVIANTPIASSYSSAGRFGTTIGYNVKAGEWGSKNAVIGTNLQVVGNNNVIMGGGDNKFFRVTDGGWGDTDTAIGNVFIASPKALTDSAMRFWGNNNIVLGAKNRTEGFNTNIGDTNSGYSGNANSTADSKQYNRITDNAITGANNSLYDLSFSNSVYGSNNLVASGRNNMVIGSSNILEAQIGNATEKKVLSAKINSDGTFTPDNPGRDAALGVADLGNLIVDKNANGTATGHWLGTANTASLAYNYANAVIGSKNRVGYNTTNNFLAGSENQVNFNSEGNFIGGANNYLNYNIDSTNIKWDNFITKTKENFGSFLKAAATDEKWKLKTETKTNNNILLGSNIAIGTNTKNNMLLGSNIVVTNAQSTNYAMGSNILFNASNAYVLGSNVNVISNNSVYIGDYSTATLKKTINTAGESGFTNYTIRGMTFNFAGIGETDGGVVTFGRIENGKSVGRVLQNVAPGLIGPNSTDAVNGSQLYALWNFVNNNTVNFVTGSGGATVTQNEPNREDSSTGGNSSAATTQPNTPPNTDTSTVPSAGETTNNTEPAENATNTNNSSTTNKLEPNTFNVHVEQTVAYVDDGGDKLTKVKGKDGKFYFYKEKDTSGKAFNATDGKWYEINGNTLEALSDEQAPKQVADEHVLMVAKLVNPKDGSVTTPAQLANIASALNVDTKEAPVSQDKAREVVAGSNKDGNGGLLEKRGTEMNTAANLSDLQAVAQAGTTFVDDQGNELHRPLGTALNIKGGATGELSSNNIGVVKTADNTLEIKLAKELKGLTSAQFIDSNGNTTVVNGNGMSITNNSNPQQVVTTVVNSNGMTVTNSGPEKTVTSVFNNDGMTITNSNNPQQQVSVTSSGLNNGGNRITNVAPGVADTDAVNLGQMKQALGGQMKDLSEDIDGVAATAGAMSGLPQAYIPGKSMVAIGTGAHRSQQAVAIGISRVSDNGKIVLKLNAGHNTAGNTTVGAGVGFQF